MEEIQHFAWMAAYAPFDPDVHALVPPSDSGDDATPVFDEAWRSLTIEGAEGQSTVAHVEIVNPGVGLLSAGRDLYAHLSLSRSGVVHHLFSGRVIGAPRSMSGDFITVTLDCRFGDIAADIEAALAPYKSSPIWDPLFVDPNRVDEPMEVLEATHAHLYVDPRTQVIRASDALLGSAVSISPVTPAAGEITIEVPDGLPFTDGVRVRVWYRHDFREHFTGPILAYEDGEMTVDADSFSGSTQRDDWIISLDFPAVEIDGESVNLTVVHKPYSAIKCVVEAQWIQAGNGVLDLAPAIKAAAGGPNIQTLSFPTEFADAWPETGASLGGQSGYTVMQSALEQQRNSLRMGPVITWFGQFSMFAVNTYDPTLLVEYSVKQKRVETATFILEGNAQALLGDESNVELLELRLQDVGDALPNRNMASFFLTDRGRQALAHGIYVAKTVMAESQRCVEVTATAPGWSINTLYLSTDHTACIHSNKLPGGAAIGKVSAFTKQMTEASRSAAITLRCSIGLGYSATEVESDNDYVEEGYVEDGYVNGAIGVASAGGPDPVTFETFADQQPTDPLVHLASWTEPDFITSLTLAPLAAEQLAYLQDHQFGGPLMGQDGTHYLTPDQTLMSRIPTVFALEMRSLETVDELRHDITVALTGAWGLPPTIDLAAP